MLTQKWQMAILASASHVPSGMSRNGTPTRARDSGYVPTNMLAFVIQHGKRKFVCTRRECAREIEARREHVKS